VATRIGKTHEEGSHARSARFKRCPIVDLEIIESTPTSRANTSRFQPPVRLDWLPRQSDEQMKRAARWGAVATERRLSGSGISISQVVDGKNVEEWPVWDQMGIMQPIGAISRGATDETARRVRRGDR
jgi:hypothetical protein